jgi:hypothetical protein
MNFVLRVLPHNLDLEELNTVNGYLILWLIVIVMPSVRIRIIGYESCEHLDENHAVD